MDRALPSAGILARARRRLAQGGRAWAKRASFGVAYALRPVDRLGFFNGGYHPLLPGFVPLPALAGAEHQANLYEYALRELPRPFAQAPPRALLDIGCGLGGGLLYAAHVFPHTELSGSDVVWSAVRAARRRLAGRAVLRVAPGHRMPFRDAAFDRLVSVGTITFVGTAPFLAEAARLISPGGLLCLTAGNRHCTPEEMRARIAAAGREAGLELLRFEDITPEVRAAQRLDAARVAAIVESLPWPLRQVGREWMTLPGTRRKRRLDMAPRIDWAALLRRPA
jgi:SAM-dependent methyltransferase